MPAVVGERCQPPVVRGPGTRWPCGACLPALDLAGLQRIRAAQPSQEPRRAAFRTSAGRRGQRGFSAAKVRMGAGGVASRGFLHLLPL
ncbi:unnamed protein product [Rangifer tarandus platyrhynchus]|uniref:Uncharacterized protein n=3 Tax=Rangifer tarandus platyrhynchus TaxID=3082113 RepID=A0AC59YR31_RANTA|nr:unnamed protein product [Rangifer tarandus platyrhynchus]CAI9699091.1 unnamed protein product [Rangifer tarandus platyrhynchus]